jgi:hypothetical protein
MHLNCHTKKTNRKTHLKKQNFMFNKKEQLFFIEQIVIYGKKIGWIFGRGWGEEGRRARRGEGRGGRGRGAA